MKDQNEIEAMRDRASGSFLCRTGEPGADYAEGIRDALAWVLEELPEELEP